MRLLLVEDEASFSQLLSRGLHEEGHTVDVCADARVALGQAIAVPYDVVMLDWGLPEMDGVSLLREWRRRGLRSPVVMLTARGTAQEKILGLRAGADDYLAKPFDFGELLARLEAVHRRGSGLERPTELGGLVIDARRRVLEHAGKSASLTAREFALFSELAQHATQTLSRTRLLTKVWGLDFQGKPNVVDVYVGYLRNKLAKLGAHRVRINSVRGVGYALHVESE